MKDKNYYSATKQNKNLYRFKSRCCTLQFEIIKGHIHPKNCS